MSVELPKDAEGREIPLDTTRLYGATSGDEYKVVNFDFCPSAGRWTVKLEKRGREGIYATECFTLTPPDSWEKLEEDLSRVKSCGDLENGLSTCAYTHQPCAVCKFHPSKDCTSAMCADIASRIRKLRGED